MKGKFALQVLEAIGEFTLDTADLLAAVFVTPYHSANLAAQRKTLAHAKWKRQKNKEEYEEYCRLAKRYRNILAWLRRDGIVKETILGRKKFICIMQKGKKYRELLLKRRRNELPKRTYSRAKSKSLVIVAFDIPEAKRRQRAWLRKALQEIGFQMIQQSVWLSYVKIPTELLEDLRQSNLIHYVEIFTVTNKGSLRKYLGAMHQIIGRNSKRRNNLA